LGWSISHTGSQVGTASGPDCGDGWPAGVLVGRNVVWCVHRAYSRQYGVLIPTLASPYLLSLGVSKSHMALVFVAGPLSGLLVQPLIGTHAILLHHS
jgi:hypothetical protein